LKRGGGSEEGKVYVEDKRRGMGGGILKSFG